MYREFGSGTVITKVTLQCNLSLLGNFYSLMVFTKLCPPVLCFWEVKFSLVHLREWTVSFQVWVPRSCVCSGGTMDNIVDT